MDLVEQHAAERSIKIIKQRLPLTAAEASLLERIINDIRLNFQLEGAVHHSNSVGPGNGPPEWFW